MYTISQFLSAALVASLVNASIACAQDRNGNQVIANFEKSIALKSHVTTHKAKVTLDKDVPAGGGSFAMKTVVGESAAESKFFGIGCISPRMNWSDSDAIQFWIRTDIESDFSFQTHSGQGKASVFRFSTKGSNPGVWTKITAPISKFRKPTWAKEEVDWSNRSYRL